MIFCQSHSRPISFNQKAILTIYYNCYYILNVRILRQFYFQKYVPDYPSAAPAAALTRGRLAYSASPEKKMVKLAPLKMAASHSFERFMAVP